MLFQLPVLMLSPQRKLQWEDVDQETVLREAFDQNRYDFDFWLEISDVHSDIVFVAALIVYFVASVRLILKHRTALLDMFSNIESKRLYWLAQFLGIFAFLWAIYVFWGDPHMAEQPAAGILTGVESFALLLLAVGVIGQLNVFSTEQAIAAREIELSPKQEERAAGSTNPQYAHSGLQPQHLIRIATNWTNTCRLSAATSTQRFLYRRSQSSWSLALTTCRRVSIR